MKTKTELPTEREESMRVIEAQGATPQMESSRHRPAIFDEAVKTLKAKEPNLSRREAADKIGCSVSTIQQYWNK